MFVKGTTAKILTRLRVDALTIYAGALSFQVKEK